MTAHDFLAVQENVLIEQLASSFSRSPHQVNRRHEADAELVEILGLEQLLVLTVDAVVEEIEMGLYDEPGLIGWITVMSAASDLAAVGADPIGLLLVEVIPEHLDAEMLNELQQHIQNASEMCGIPVLGGDTNRGTGWLMAATAVGVVPKGMQLTRMGARSGDVLCATGPLGTGSAFAAARLCGREVPFLFRPEARIAAGRLLRDFAGCCIDTSDGALAALDQLMRLNRVGFEIEDLDAVLHPFAQQAAEDLNVPEWIMLAGLHGEFELLFTVSEEQMTELAEEAGSLGWMPVRLGVVCENQKIQVSEQNRQIELDTGRLRGLFDGPIPPISKLIVEMLACGTYVSAGARS